ncbi:MAG: GTP cyclohydrolase MptA [Thermoplasmata archaeon]
MIIVIAFGEFIKLPDVQSRTPASSYHLTRVGVKGVKKPVHIRRGSIKSILMPTIDLFVDLPATQKGSHLSRNIEVINEIVDSSVREPVDGLETMCAVIAKRLLEKHSYASRSQVIMSSDYFLERKAYSNRKSIENYRLIAQASAEKKNHIPTKKSIGVEVIGMTACPCALETVKQMLGTDRAKRKVLKEMPVMTHNQRNISSLMIEVSEEYPVDANDLIDIVENSFSSPTYEMLKREDEGKIVLRAHRNPKFVEDVVRDILRQVLKSYKYLPDDVVVIARSESEESIHKHNAFAEKVTTLGELRGHKNPKKGLHCEHAPL